MNKKFKFVLLLLIVVVLIGSQEALAWSSYLSSFNTKYGTSGSRLDTCGLCHINPAGGGAKNSYGTDYGNNSHNFTAIEKLDSDKDGYSNLVEIRARTFPGNATDHPVPVLKTIKVTPASVSLVMGNTAFKPIKIDRFTGITLDQFGKPISVKITWESSNTTVGIINASTGIFTAKAVGKTNITAANGTIKVNATVTIAR